jgi:hypothetical protein
MPRTTSSILSRPIPAPKIPPPARSPASISGRRPGEILTEQDREILGRNVGLAQDALEERGQQQLSALDFLGSQDLQQLQRAALPGVRTKLEGALREATPRGASLLSQETRQGAEREITLLGQAASQRVTGLRTEPGVIRAKGGLITRRRKLI